jgi:hypothetical protein
MNSIQLGLDFLDPERLQCAMLYHFDQSRYTVLLSTRVSRICDEAEARPGIRVERPAEFATVFIDAPSRDEIEVEAKQEAHRGMDAGDILVLLHEMVASGIKEPSVRKAIKLRELHLRDRNYRLADGSTPNRSESTIRANLERHRPAAHLWAAASYFSTYPGESVTLSKALYQDLPFFLAVAEAYRRFGEHWVAIRDSTKKTFLNPQETLSIVGQLELPVIEFARAKGDCPTWVASQLMGRSKRKGSRGLL